MAESNRNTRYQLSRFLVLMEQFDEAADATKTATESQGSAMKENEKYLDSYEAKLNEVKNAWTEAIMDLEDDFLGDALVSFTDAAVPTIKAFGQIIDKVGLLPTTFMAATAAVYAFNSSLRSKALEQGGGIVRYFKNLPTYTSKSNAALVSHLGVMDRVKNTTKMASTAFGGLGKAAGGALRFLAGAALPIAAFWALGEAISFVTKKFQEHQERVQDHEKSLDSYTADTENVKDLVDQYEELSNINDKSTEEHEKYVNVQNELAQLLPTVKTGEDEKGNAIIASTQAIEGQIKALDQLAAKEEQRNLNTAEDDIRSGLSGMEKHQGRVDEQGELADQLSTGLDGNFFTNTQSSYDMAVDKMRVANDKLVESTEGAIKGFTTLAQQIQSLNEADVNWAANIGVEEKMSPEKFEKFSQNLGKMKQELGEGFDFSGLDLSQVNILQDNLDEISKADPGDNNVWQDLSTKLKGAGVSGDELKQTMGQLRYTEEDLDRAASKNTDSHEKQIPVFNEAGKVIDWKTKSTDDDTDANLENAQAVEENAEAHKEAIDKYNEATGNIQSLNGVIDELNEGNGLTADSVELILDKYDHLLPHLNDEITLKELLQEETVKEGQIATDVMKDKLIGNEQFVKASLDGNSQLYKLLTEIYGEDLKNFETVSQAKKDVNQQLIQNMAGAWSKFFRTTKDGFVELDRVAVVFDNAERQRKKQQSLVEQFMPGQFGLIQHQAYTSKESEINSALGNVQGQFDELENSASKALDIDTDGVAADLDSLGSSAAENAGKAGNSVDKAKDSTDKASDSMDKASDAMEEMGKEYESTIFIADELSESLEKVNDQIDRQQVIQSKYPEYSKKYRKSLEKEIELLEKKKNLTSKQANKLKKQIESGQIDASGVLTSVAGRTQPNQKEDPNKSKSSGGSNKSGSGSSGSSGGSGAYTGKYAKQINASAKRHGVNPFLVAAIIQQESGFNPNARSHVGAQGLMQLMPGTASGLGVTNASDPTQNIEGGTKYIAQQLKAFGGDVTKALAAYNAGPGNVRKHGGVPPFKETQNYVKVVQDNLKKFGGSLQGATQAVGGASSKMNETANYYLDNFEVTSPYGKRWGTMHKGTDFANGKSGDPVKALRGGSVETAGYSQSAGNWVVVKQDDGTTAKYMHMLEDLRVKQGDNVQAGQQIGRVGSTGQSTGDHIHIQLERDGQAFDSLPYIEDLAKEAAESQESVHDAKSDLREKENEMKEIEDRIEELYMSIVESHLASFDHAKEKIEKDLSKVSYFQARHGEDSNAWVKQQRKREDLMNKQNIQQKKSIKFLEKEIKTNKNLEDYQKMELRDKLRERQTELWDMEEQLLQERIQMYEKLEDVFKRAYEAQKEVALDTIDDMIDEIDEKEKERDYKKKLEDEQKSRQEILDEIAEWSMDDSDTGKKRVKELTKELQESDENIDEMQHDKEVEERKESLEEEKEEVEQEYDDLINDEKAFNKMRSQMIKGNTKSISKQLDKIYADIKGQTDVLGKSAVNSIKRSIEQLNNAYLPQSKGMKVPKFDSGGLTSAKSNKGGMAVLHDKELVLNSEDTKNILDTVDLTRNMAMSMPKVPKRGETNQQASSNDTHISVNVENSDASRNQTQNIWKEVVSSVNKKGGKI